MDVSQKGCERMLKTQKMVSTKKARKFEREGKFPCTVCWKGVDSHSVLCQFCMFWVQNSGASRRLSQEDSLNVRIRKLGNRHNRGVFRHRIKCSMSRSCGKVVLSWCFLGDL